MKKAASISKMIAGIIASVNGLCALSNNTSDAFSNLSSWANLVYIAVFIALGIFLILGSILDFIVDHRKSVRRHKFQYQSERFFKFFADWYQQPGTLSIICGDLEWIKNDKNTAIYDQLLTKSINGELNLVLGSGIHSAIVSELQSKGARVMLAPNNIVSTYTFSCLSIMDDAAGKIIVRDKRRNPSPNIGEVIFEELSNTYVTELLNALLAEKGHVHG